MKQKREIVFVYQLRYYLATVFCHLKAVIL